MAHFLKVKNAVVRWHVLLLATVILLLMPASASAQCGGRWVVDPTNIPPGLGEWEVARASIVLPNGDLVVGGDFTTAGGVSANRIARWNGSSWSSLGSGMNDRVYALTVLPNGDLVAGGWFTTAGGVTANRIARWNGTTWSPLGSGISGTVYADGVYALAVLPNGDLVAGGRFTSAGGVSANRIARWNGSSWSALGAGVGGGASAQVDTLAVLANGDMVAGGLFTTAGGVAASNIARWNGAAWSPLGTGTGGRVYALAVSANGDVVAGGQFTTAGGVPANRIARWNGTTWSALGSGVNSDVFTLCQLPSGDLIVGGNFWMAGSVSTSSIARWNGTSWASLGAGLPGTGEARVRALAVLQGGNIVAVGGFRSSGGRTLNGVAEWDGASWSPFGSGFSGQINASVVLPSGDLVAGGSFSTAGGVAANRIARWNGSAWSPLGSGMSGNGVFALAVLPNGDLVAGGDFFSAGGQSGVPNIARWNGSAWSPLGSGISDTVYALAVLPNGDLVAGGDFTTAGGVTANRIARWNGTTWSPLGSGMNNTVYALAVLPNGDLVAGGDFTPSVSTSLGRIARWDGTSWSPMGSGTGFNNEVRSLAVLPSGGIVAGGRFTSAFGVSLNRVARWDGATWSALGSGVNIPNSFNIATVLSLAVLPNGDVVAGGEFTTAGGATANYVARWNGTTWFPLASGLGGGGGGTSLNAIALLPGRGLFAGGRFSTAGGSTTSSWALWTDTGVPWVAEDPASQSPSSGSTITLEAACAAGFDFNGPVAFRWQRNGADIANGPGGASGGGGTVSGASGSLTSANTTTTLTITGIRPSDAGQYTVLFTNSCGTGVSLPATVTVSGGCLADLNNDAVVNGIDLAAVLGAWGTNGQGDFVTDLNADGIVDGQDLAFVLSGWGSCP